MRAGFAALCLVTAAAVPSTDRASMTADLLARADRAAAGTSRAAARKLDEALTTLDRIGVRAEAEGDGATALADWRSRSVHAELPYRGRVLGPAFRRGWLEPGAAARVDQLFLAGQNASVAVSGAPDRGVKLAVAGRDAPAGCTGTDRSCRWVPIFTQRYTITVRNGGKSATRYYLVMD